MSIYEYLRKKSVTTRRYVRAVRGGVGEAKCAGNYAAGFIAQREAAANGCDQVVWLDAIDRETVEER